MSEENYTELVRSLTGVNLTTPAPHGRLHEVKNMTKQDGLHSVFEMHPIPWRFERSLIAGWRVLDANGEYILNCHLEALAQAITKLGNAK